MTNGIEKFIDEMEKERALESKTEKEERKKITKRSEKEQVRDLEEKDLERPSGWSEDYYGIKRDGPVYRSRRRIIISEDSAGVIRETVE